MNYLQLTNDFLIETQMDDTVQTLTSLQDDVEQAATWIRDAWLEIQRNRNWKFRWAVDVFPTVAGKRIYTLEDIGRVAGDDIDLKNLTLLNGTVPLTQFNWRDSIGDYSTGTPMRVGERPDEALVIDPIPDAVHNIVYEYFTAPQILIADDDEPRMDPSFHKAIVWRAVQAYAREQGNEWRGLHREAKDAYKEIYAAMLNRYLPQMTKRPLHR